jgi:surface protein
MYKKIIYAGLVVLSFLSNSSLLASQNDFVTTWKTDNSGTSASTEITIPTVGGGYSYDVDWDNDGTFDEFGITGNVTHDFGSTGTYTIRIQGSFPRIYFNLGGDRLKLLSVDQWGTNAWTTFNRAFRGCSNMHVLATDAPVLTVCRDLSSIFAGCQVMNEDLSNWDVSGITNFQRVFYDCFAFNQPLASWDVSSATNMFGMFLSTDFNQDISGWDVSGVGNFGWMFRQATDFNQDISGWNTSSATNFVEMFRRASSFDQDLGQWDVSGVTNATKMFGTATLSTANYDALLTGWNAQTLKPGVTFSGGNSLYCSSWAERDDMINIDGWIITDNGSAGPTPDIASLSDVTSTCDVNTLVFPTATDNCAPGVTVTNNAVFPITEGTTVVTWTYTDSHGGVSTQDQNVIVDDITAPVGDLASLADVLDVCDVTSLVAPTGNDECASIVTVTGNAVFPITEGTTIVTWTYDDGHGNTSTQDQNVIVDDITAPVGDSVSLADVLDVCDITSLVAPTGNDECDTMVTVTNDAVFPITEGTTIVTWTYDDGHGNTSTQMQNVIVDDITAPVGDSVSLADVLAECDASPSAPTGTDECATVVMVTSNVVFPITMQGTTVVTWTFDDGNGNTSTQDQNVVITDVTAPVADVASLNDVTGCFEATPTPPTATDNCMGPLTATPDFSFPIIKAGTTVVTWTYNDGNGNTSTQTQNVIVNTVDVNVTQSGGLLTANAIGAAYKWLDCDNGNAMVNGETNQAFTPAATGNFAVEVTENGCVDTSACYIVDYTGLDDLFSVSLLVYPNPSNNGYFNIQFEGTISAVVLYDMLGRIIEVPFNVEQGSLDASSLAAGKYIISINSNDGVFIKQIVIAK